LFIYPWHHVLSDEVSSLDVSHLCAGAVGVYFAVSHLNFYVRILLMSLMKLLVSLVIEWIKRQNWSVWSSVKN